MEATYVHNWKTAAGILVLVVRGREVVVWEVLPKDGAEAGGLFCWPGTSMKNAWLYMWPGVGTVYEPGQAECFKHSASLYNSICLLPLIYRVRTLVGPCLIFT